MSVINDMLRDLDQRRAPARESIAGAQGTNLVQPERKNVIWMMAMALVIVLLTVLVLVVWLKAPLGQPGLTAESETADQSDTAPASSLSQTGNTAEGNIAPVSVPKVTLPDSGPEHTEVQQVAASGLEKNASALVVKPAPEDITPLASKNNQKKGPVPDKIGVSASARDLAKSASGSEVAEKTTQASANTQSVNTSNKNRRGQDHSEQTLVSHTQNNDAPVSQVRLTPIALDRKAADEAAGLIDAGDAEAGRRLLYSFISEHEQDSACRTLLAKHLMQTKRYAEAGDLLTVVEASDIPELKAVKARWLVTFGRMNEALALLSEQLPAVDEYSDYHALLASFYHQQKQFEQAVERYSALLEFNSDVADWWVGMGIGLDQLKRYEDAALAYRQALALPNLKSSLAQYSEQRLRQLSSGRSKGA
ncbi:MAG: hypothetical protein C9356_05105 [Oleiphilus sp.]|nr:MAG: hypothetical protein C9356_05105 [Oleiphilus sp.]